jgi:hypothetical protein
MKLIGKFFLQKLSLLLIINLLSQVGYSQNSCFTEGNQPDILANRSVLLPARPNYTIRIFAHFLRHPNLPNGGGIANWEFNQALDLLKADFEPHGICFTVIGTSDIIDANLYYDDLVTYNGTNFTSPVFNINRHQNAIDIYFAPINNNTHSAMASGIPGGAIVIGGSYSWIPFQTVPPQAPPPILTKPLYLTRVISHEMGHCLGLYHTHHQKEPGGCPDCADLTNCNICGDYVCDTPPDPNIVFHVNSLTCAWDTHLQSGTANTDVCGLPWTPDATLIMSYSNAGCYSHFSNGQGQRMRDVIANNPTTRPRLQRGCQKFAFVTLTMSFFLTDIQQKMVNWLS